MSSGISRVRIAVLILVPLLYVVVATVGIGLLLRAHRDEAAAFNALRETVERTETSRALRDRLDLQRVVDDLRRQKVSDR